MFFFFRYTGVRLTSRDRSAIQQPKDPILRRRPRRVPCLRPPTWIRHQIPLPSIHAREALPGVLHNGHRQTRQQRRRVFILSRQPFRNCRPVRAPTDPIGARIDEHIPPVYRCKCLRVVANDRVVCGAIFR